MSDTPKNAPAGRVPRWIKVLLTLSLAVNLLIAGLAAGAAMRFNKSGPDRAARGGFAYVAALERGERREMLSTLRDVGKSRRTAEQEIMQNVLKALRAETLDADQLEALMNNQSQLGEGMRGEIQTALIARLSQMSPSERASYADRLEHVLEHGGRKSRRPKD